jgi:hypothetical protein
MNRNISFFRLDEQVLLTLAGVSLLAILVLGFKMISNKPCTDVIVMAEKDSVLQNSTMKFKAETKYGKEYLWVFGDGSSEKTESNIVDHVYKKSGKYFVSVVVNGNCEAGVRNVYVKPAIVEFSLPRIIGPDTVFVDETFDLRENGGSHEKYDWTVDGKKAGGWSQLQSVVFTSPGPHKIKLVVNNNPKLFDEITVFAKKPKNTGENVNMPSRRARPREIPLPDEPVSPPLPVPDPKPVEVEETKKEEELPKKEKIDEEGLKSLCIAVKNKQKSAEDFDKYICDMASSKVTYNGELMSISMMCEKLRALKKKADISIPKLNLSSKGCVTGFSISAKNKPFIPNPFNNKD